MAFFSFSKKDKNLPEPAVAQPQAAPAAPTVPQVKTPPVASSTPPPPSLSPVKPPAPSAAFSGPTQPIGLQRSGPPGAAPRLTRGTPVQSRATQRIVLPTAPSTAGSAAPSLAAAVINLPAGMILRSLPEATLVAPMSELESSGRAAQEVQLPLHLVLPQLPSGKIEIAFQDLVSILPQDLLQPSQNLTTFLSQQINLPLMDIVMRIPPDMLALRPDQKAVDSSVVNMADPFTEEILREQHEAARKEAAAKIIDETQIPQHEEFVPQKESKPASTPAPVSNPPPPPLASAPKPPTPLPTPPPLTTAPAPTTLPPLAPARPPVLPPAPQPATTSAPPIPAVNKLPTTASRLGPIGGSPTPASISAAATIPMRDATLLAKPPQMGTPRSQSAPTRSTAPVPTRLGPTPSTPSVPPLPKPTLPTSASSSLMETQSVTPPSPPSPHTAKEVPAVIPTVTPPASPTMEVSAPEPVPLTESAVPEEVPKAPEPAPAPPTDLAQLAALAMSQIGDEEHTSVSHPIEDSTPGSENPPKPSVQETPFLQTPNLPEIQAETEPQSQPEPEIKDQDELPAEPADQSAPLNLNTCTVAQLEECTGIDITMAEAIVNYRENVGPFQRLEELLEVPGMTAEVYTLLTGEDSTKAPPSINELLGFPLDQPIKLKDVTDRICCWSNVVGCVLGQSSGLSLVGETPAGLEKSALVAFAPRMFESLNRSFSEFSNQSTNEIIIPTPDISYHILRHEDIYLIILSSSHQIPSRHLQVARYVLQNINIRDA